jgi:DNA-binding transcriptional ArsR family regulator
VKEYEPIESLERVSALLHPLRVRLLALAAEPVSAVEAARELGVSPQKVNYHLKALEKQGLVRKVREEKLRNLTKAWYQAQARRLWLSPLLLAEQGGEVRAARDELSLHHLLGLARELERDVIATLNRLRGARERGQASLGVKAELAFADGAARRAFLEEYMASLERLIRKHAATAGASAAERYTAMVAVYPSPAAKRRAAPTPKTGERDETKKKSERKRRK